MGPSNVDRILIDKYFILHVLWEFEYGSYKVAKHPAKHIFCTLNGRACWQRAMFMDSLAQYKLLKNNVWTWNQKYTDKKYVPQYWKPKEKRLETVMEPKRLPKESFVCALNVGTETNPDVSFITEKTYRPMLYRQMPLMFGAYKMHDYLEDIGFKLSPVVDYSFDSIPSMQSRADALARELKRLGKTYSPQEIREANKEAVEHNFNHLLDTASNYYPSILLEHEYYRQQKEEITNRIEYLNQYRSLT
jgi:hypothetical protein